MILFDFAQLPPPDRDIGVPEQHIIPRSHQCLDRPEGRGLCQSGYRHHLTRQEDELALVECVCLAGDLDGRVRKDDRCRGALMSGHSRTVHHKTKKGYPEANNRKYGNKSQLTLSAKRH
mmetsp:Transcript_8059/g.13190  ORF Transcript_8059/g.13190 Transcript_8059/m.13190 type:complete len:119 (-) Transcript_8059:5-361(-)